MDKLALADRFDGYSSIFANDHPIGVDLKAMANTLRKMPEEKFASIVNAGYEEKADKEKEKEKEAFITTERPYQGPSFGHRNELEQGGLGIHRAIPQGGAGAVMKPELAQQAAAKAGIPSDKLQKFIAEYSKADAAAATAEVEATAQPMTDPWTKSAADHVAQNLVRDVLGMNKTQIEDTHRHITKEQTMDGKKAPQLKNVVERQEDTGRALTPEQTPDISERLDSNMYQKSKGSVEGVTKKLATTEETPDAKAAEPQEVKKEEKEKEAKEMTPEETAKKVKEMEDKKKKEEAKAKSRPEKPAEKEAETAIDANTLVAEGIEFDNVMQDGIDMDSPEIKKLSSLFE